MGSQGGVRRYYCKITIGRYTISTVVEQAEDISANGLTTKV